jgi:hypothetical protein
LLTISGSSPPPVHVRECLPALDLFRSFNLNLLTNLLLPSVTHNADSHGKRIGRQNPHQPPTVTPSRKAKPLSSMEINRYAKERLSDARLFFLKISLLRSTLAGFCIGSHFVVMDLMELQRCM